MAKRQYSYVPLRYVPRPDSGEFYNVGLIFYEPDGRLAEARFTPDFDRMRCNPAVNLSFLVALRAEFEDNRLLGEQFSAYIEELTRRTDHALELGPAKAFLSAELPRSIDRLVDRKLATLPGLNRDRGERGRGLGRLEIRNRTAAAFARHGLFANGHGMQRGAEIRYGPTGLKFTFDFSYQAADSPEQFIHALSLRSAEAQAPRFCFVYGDYLQRSGSEAGLTIIADDAVGEGVRNLLGDHGIGAVNLSAIDTYAETLREKLGL